jgi:hypothetical protein
MDSRLASEPFPGFRHIYELADPCSNRAFRASVELGTDEALLLRRGEAGRGQAVRARWAMGAAKPGDVIWSTLAMPLLISERAVGILRDGRFKGWDVVPVELSDKTGAPLPTHYYLGIHGRCGPIDDRRSVKFDKIMPGGAFQWWRGLFFDPATWDGSDLFMPQGNVGWIFVVEAVKRAFEKGKVKNIRFTALDEVERMKIGMAS